MIVWASGCYPVRGQLHGIDTQDLSSSICLDVWFVQIVARYVKQVFRTFVLHISISLGMFQDHFSIWASAVVMETSLHHERVDE